MGNIHYVYYDLGEDLFTFRDKMAKRIKKSRKPLTIQDYIILGTIGVEAGKDMLKYHQEGYTLGDCKLENIAIKTGTSPQETKARHIDLETVGLANRRMGRLTHYTHAYLKILDPAHPHYHLATIDNDLHALAITIWSLACWEDLGRKMKELNESRDPKESTRIFSSIFEYTAEPAAATVIGVFLEYTNRLRSGKREYHLKACYQFMQTQVNAWNHGRLMPCIPSSDEEEEMPVHTVESPIHLTLRRHTGMAKQQYQTITPMQLVLSEKLLPNTGTDNYCKCCCKCCY